MNETQLTGTSLYHSTIINASPDFVYMVLLLNSSIQYQLYTVLNLQFDKMVQKQVENIEEIRAYIKVRTKLGHSFMRQSFA